ncbi:Radical SAM methylthiotransferase, MiaB/RimO family [Desulfonema limicola]|uniref:tRNA-2-methylthio-N(6)-dimethylallyladenosine synthase n=1 Tax=Desulfonema limicola TaxID=45656 RepID=A0A975BAH0_9BACT|nr:tRNA (N6-isopentenyl adenosine(37)-C2)-methylthiotransferase MiaB [Desulfonema limicola]QTA81742.1 Radical SAM methylthiotransferase, MiaB/RimO family [Desulfonema limicola]
MKSRNLYINTIGCQMNVYDSEQIAGLLSTLGYKLTDFEKKADMIIVNTCAIREKAEQKVFSYLGRMADMKKKKPELIIGVGGCVAQQEGRNILKRVPWVDIVFGTHAIARLPEIVQRVESKRCRVVDIEMTPGIDEFELPEINNQPDISRFVTIMQGCDNFCTYCVVPYVRGRETSRNPENIINEIKNLVKSGIKEITLLGQNVNSYGKKQGMCSFPELLEQVNAVEGLLRIRFTTSHPKDLSQDLMYAFKNLDKLCNHIHLPVQSGSNNILKRMNRKYTRELYLEKVEQLRTICPDIAISSDMIAGFPGESDSDFNQTLELMKIVEYDSLFAFKYSDRPNAPAGSFSDKISESEKKARLKEILNLQEHYTLKKNKAMIGSTAEILVDGLSKRNTEILHNNELQFTGRTSTNKIVNFIHNLDKGCDTSKDDINNLTGKIISIEITDGFANSLKGSPVDINYLN